MLDIIIPVYNANETLPRALASILAQTEPSKCIVTIVDDGSTEDTKFIVNRFSPFLKINYYRMPENTGSPGIVRETGLSITNAPYVMFLDADDMLTNFAVELANREMRYNCADVMIGYFYAQNKNTYEILNEQNTTWLHGKVYRRSFLEKYGISFSSGYNEDGAFNTECFLLGRKIAYLEEPLSFWLENPRSLTRREDKDEVKFTIDLIENLKYAYLNIFKYKKDDHVYDNIGKHLFLFFKKYYELQDNRITHKIQDFVKKLELDKCDDERREDLKKGFLHKLAQQKWHCDKYKIDNFFWNIDLQILFSFDDINLILEGENESNNN